MERWKPGMLVEELAKRARERIEALRKRIEEFRSSIAGG